MRCGLDDVGRSIGVCVHLHLRVRAVGHVIRGGGGAPQKASKECDLSFVVNLYIYGMTYLIQV